jgi:hypothetical protein
MKNDLIGKESLIGSTNEKDDMAFQHRNAGREKKIFRKILLMEAGYAGTKCV